MNGTIRWLGVAFVEYRTPEGRTILFDPWTKDHGSPSCPYTSDDFRQVDLVLVSHDHFDHVSSAPSICSGTGALLGGPNETVKKLVREKKVKNEQVLNGGSGYIAGGGSELPWVEIVATQAVHTSESSAALGTIILPQSGATIYHTGDTGIFTDMKLYGELYPVDLLILPVFGTQMMNAYRAAHAVRLVQPKKVLPIHYDVWDEPEKRLKEFITCCGEIAPEVQILALKNDESVEL